MATPPTFVANYEKAYSGTTTPGTVSVTVAAGDTLCVVGGTEDQSYLLSGITGGGLTYTLAQSVEVASHCTAYGWTAPSASSQTYTLSIARSTAVAALFGFDAVRFSGSDGVGASAKTNITSGAPSLAITTTADNSAIVVIVTDWNATDGTSRTWRTVNGITPSAGNALELRYFRDAAHYTAYVAYYSDAGVAGAKTVGISAPTGQKYSIVALEIKGTAAAGASIAPDGISVPVTLGSPTLSDGSLSAAPDGVSVPVALGTPTLTDGSMAVAPTGVPVPVTLGDPALSWTGSIAPDGIAVPVALGAPIVGAVAVNPDGISVPVVLGDPALSWSATAAPDGIGVPVVLGSPTLTLSGIAPDGISVPVVLGSPVLAWSGTVSPDGISVPVSLGAPGVGVPVVVANGSSTATVTASRSSTPVVARSVTSTSTVTAGRSSTPSVAPRGTSTATAAAAATSTPTVSDG